MAGLFVALPLPADVRRVLAALCPHRAPGVSPSSQGQFHLTLHYIGTAVAPEAAIAALSRVAAQRFEMVVEGLGTFPEDAGRLTRAAPRVLWAGVRPSEGLSALHRAVRATLGAEDATGPFRPHITLARLRSAARAPSVADAFLAQRLDPRTVAVEAAGLYVNDAAPGSPSHYRRLAVVPLI